MNDSWIELADKKVSAVPQRERIRGVDVTVYVSPYSAPTALRANLDREGNFLIWLRYLNESEITATPTPSRDGLVRFYLGETTGRIEKIRIAKELIESGDVELRIKIVEEAKKGILELKEKESSLSRRLGLGAARTALESSMDQLIESARTAASLVQDGAQRL